MQAPQVKCLGLTDYAKTYQAMQQFALTRVAGQADEVWLTEHPAVYTQGIAGKAEHILHKNTIPVVATDRGGQITYHGPGQGIMYVLLDIKTRQLGVRALVSLLEESVIDLLAQHQVVAQSRPDAPGVYVQEQKIASLGLRIKRGCSYHGVALNIDMDLSPFLAINPCGHAGLSMTQCRDLGFEYEVLSGVLPLLLELSEIFIASLANIGSRQ